MSFWEVIWEGLVDAVGDTATLVPFLFATYVAMEALEHAGLERSRRLVSKAGRAGPAVGALLGAVPQCGFAAMAATLYAVRVVTLGTLIAVMLSTSDEMLPVFVANGAPAQMIFAIVGFKIVVGIVAGFLVDGAVRVWRGPEPSPKIHELCEREGCPCDGIGEERAAESPLDACGRPCREGEEAPSDGLRDHAEAAADGHAHDHGHDRGRGEGRWPVFRGIALAALHHTVQVTLFILAITFVLDLVLEGVGDEAIATYLIAHPSQAVVVSGVVGLIPNCAASVIISQLFLDGALGSGALISGLLVSAGVSLLVLFRTDRSWGRDFAVCAILVAVGIVCGIAVNLSGFSFA